MKRALVLLLTLALTVPLPLGADERTVKKELIAELLDIIDTKALTQASFDLVFNRMGESGLGDLELDEEQAKEYAAQLEKQKEEMRIFRERLYTRIDYAKYAEEVYAPLFDKHFTADELRELIVFYKTKPGQKTARMLPDMAIGGFMKGMELVQEEAQKVSEEMAQEEKGKHPWKATMADLRTIATATEARATDTNDYPQVTSLDELQKLLEPTYIRHMPKADGWGTPFAYVSDGKSYRFASAGSDRRFDWNAKQIEPLPEANVEPRYMEKDEADIIFQDGVFVQAPAKARENRND